MLKFSTRWRASKMTEADLQELADRLRLYLMTKGRVQVPYQVANLGAYKITRSTMGTMVSNQEARVFF